MSCLRSKCICRNCRPKDKKGKPEKVTKKDLLNKARMAYAIGALWKRIGKDWEQYAKETK